MKKEDMHSFVEKDMWALGEAKFSQKDILAIQKHKADLLKKKDNL